MPHFLFKHVLWWLLRKLQLYGNTLKHFRNIINVPFAVTTFLLFCFFLLYPLLFYNCKIKFHFFIFNMFSYFLWNFECFGVFFHIMTPFSVTSLNNFLVLSILISLFYIASLIKPGTHGNFSTYILNYLQVQNTYFLFFFSSSGLPSHSSLFCLILISSIWKLGTLNLKKHKISVLLAQVWNVFEK